ncbi:MAG: hypothetical protein EOR72_21470 [Mesorhizobium sp.]|uniref:hypothetical protein n=1 Tax=Mesorhizobium sp. TaxID=1871066 RepID=UPI000FEA2525|nr:hypothetical protein [Mesorhizobium sp.]RWM12402.1 MAG: hypothetical protein EOR72_21470 [Mesorhizobium sp.]
MSLLATGVPDEATWWFAADSLQSCPSLPQQPPETRAVSSPPDGKITPSRRFIAEVRRSSERNLKSFLTLDAAAAEDGDDKINRRGGHNSLAPSELNSAENVDRNRLAHNQTHQYVISWNEDPVLECAPENTPRRPACSTTFASTLAGKDAGWGFAKQAGAALVLF